MSDYLPANIWSKILLKLPVESLIRCTTVCKSWKSLIMSPYFIYAHLSHPKNHYFPLEFMVSGSNGSFLIEADELPLNPKEGDYNIVGSCDGILCLSHCFLEDRVLVKNVILWNPSVLNHVVLPDTAITSYPKGPHITLLGFGVANHVYKVVRCWMPDIGVPPQAEIFSLGMERWRSVSAFDIKLRVSDSMWHQVLLKGIIHWLGHERIDDGSSRSSILTFDIGDELFGEVMLPDVLALKNTSELCLYKMGGSLAVGDSGVDYDYCVVWVMKEYGVKASWTKLCSIDLPRDDVNDIGFQQVVGFKNVEALLTYSKPDGCVAIISYNLETKQFKEIESCGPRLHHVVDYVESLLLLKGVMIMVRYEGDIMRFESYLPLGVEKLKEEVGRRLELEMGGFQLKYMAEDNDEMLIADDEDLQLCPKTHTSTGTTCIHLFVEELGVGRSTIKSAHRDHGGNKKQARNPSLFETRSIQAHKRPSSSSNVDTSLQKHAITESTQLRQRR